MGYYSQNILSGVCGFTVFRKVCFAKKSILSLKDKIPLFLILDFVWQQLVYHNHLQHFNTFNKKIPLDNLIIKIMKVS